MNKLEFSPLVKTKLKILKGWLTEHYGEEKAKKVLTEMASDVEILIDHERTGTNIAETYKVDTNYWYLFTHQHYLVYRIDPQKVIIVQMFHEREDFMMKLFGVSGRTQESIDYWGE
jgi:plasmid stabilization system protein ParE